MTRIPDDHNARTPAAAAKDFESELGNLYATIFLKGLNLPYEIVKHLNDDEWKLGISVFFSVGSKRTVLVNQLQSVVETIIRDRMTEPERRRAVTWTAVHWPQPAEGEQSAEPGQVAPRQRNRRPKPSRLAKWEAHWQAEQDAEDES